MLTYSGIDSLRTFSVSLAEFGPAHCRSAVTYFKFLCVKICRFQQLK